MGEQMRISLEEAVEKIKKRTARLTEVSKKLEDINGEVTAEDILAVNDQPPFPRSPLDGYALRGEDTDYGETEVQLYRAGKPFQNYCCQQAMVYQRSGCTPNRI